MRVLIWTGLYPPDIGGLEVLVQALTQGLRQRGHELLVIASQTSPKLPEISEDEGIPVYRYSFTAALQRADPHELMSLLQRVMMIKKEFRPAVVMFIPPT